MVHKFSRRTDKIERFIEHLSCIITEFNFINKIYSTQPFFSNVQSILSSFFYPRKKLEIENKILILLRWETKHPKGVGFHLEVITFNLISSLATPWTVLRSGKLSGHFQPRHRSTEIQEVIWGICLVYSLRKKEEY